MLLIFAICCYWSIYKWFLFKNFLDSMTFIFGLWGCEAKTLSGSRKLAFGIILKPKLFLDLVYQLAIVCERAGWPGKFFFVRITLLLDMTICRRQTANGKWLTANLPAANSWPANGKYYWKISLLKKPLNAANEP